MTNRLVCENAKIPEMITKYQMKIIQKEKKGIELDQQQQKEN